MYVRPRISRGQGLQVDYCGSLLSLHNRQSSAIHVFNGDVACVLLA